MLNVATEVAALQRMTVRELRIRYTEVFGEKTKVGNEPWLIKRIAWRPQSLEEGDLSERAHQRAAELADIADGQHFVDDTLLDFQGQNPKKHQAKYQHHQQELERPFGFEHPGKERALVDGHFFAGGHLLNCLV